LLFTDPINEAPVLTLDPPAAPVTRHTPADFTVTVHDEEPAPLDVYWAVFGNPTSGGCDWITADSWSGAVPVSLLPSYAAFSFTPESLDVVCVCARVTDVQGASAQACQRVAPVNFVPVAVITDPLGAPVATQQPKCSQIQVSAVQSKLVPDDTLQFAWTLDYSGTDFQGRQARLGPCTGPAAAGPGAQQCFYAPVPGVYTVGLTLTATIPGTTVSATSAPATVVISVGADRPACMVQSSPDLMAKWILLARSPSLGAKYESRTFTVSTVDDDCEPFPARTDTPTTQQATFIWSVMDVGKSTWDVQANPTNANSYKVDQESFPNARPGDTIGLRVEVRDTPAQALYQVAGPLCTDTTPICCGANGCTGASYCVRWTTWTVQFQP
jgi:hypothetical protein